LNQNGSKTIRCILDSWTTVSWLRACVIKGRHGLWKRVPFWTPVFTAPVNTTRFTGRVHRPSTRLVDRGLRGVVFYTPVDGSCSQAEAMLVDVRERGPSIRPVSK